MTTHTPPQNFPLRLSYDGIFLSALAAGVAVCAIVGFALVQRAVLVVASLIVVALLVAFGGFGGLLVRHSTTFLVLFAVFFALTLISFLIGRAVATRADEFLTHRHGFCAPDHGCLCRESRTCIPFAIASVLKSF